MKSFPSRPQSAIGARPTSWLLAILPLILFASGASADSRLAAHLRFLASDELAGRRVGEVGNQVAARYLAEQFRALDLETLPGQEQFLLPLPLLSVEPPPTGIIEIAGRTLQIGQDFVLLAGSGKATGLEVAAVDLSPGVAVSTNSLKDRVGIASLSGLRGGLGALEDRRRRAARAGAVVLLEVFEASGWENIRGFLSRPRTQLDAETAPTLPIVHVIVNDPDSFILEALRTSSDLRLSLAVEAPLRKPLQAHNVGALIRGSDAALADEYVVLTAHFDHLGAGAGIRGATADDDIFNGARDNAMGVVALLEAARQLAADPPARSVVVLAVNAEEAGLMGSRYYAAHPAVPLAQTMFVLNTDSGGFTDTGAITLIGTGRTTADPVIADACGELGLRLLPDPGGANLFGRSDNISFARAGVPALTLSPGMHRFDPQSMPHYHQPSDEAGPDFDYAYLEVFANAFAVTARKVADHPGRIRWSEDQPYAEAARKLYGSSY